MRKALGAALREINKNNELKPILEIAHNAVRLGFLNIVG